MYYLIHTPHHPRPYLSTISFIAHDFATWNCRVTCHAKSSPYITEIRYQEKRNRPASRRIELMEVWAGEVLARRGQPTPPPSPPEPQDREAAREEQRKKRASTFMQDFVTSLSAFESPILAPRALPNDPLPLPAHPFALVAKYTRLLHRCAYTTHAALPAWTHPSVAAADQVSLDFRFEESVRRDQLSRALDEAVGKREGRMGRVERCAETGVTRVLMWVDVGDLVGGEDACVKDGVADPVPLYEVGAWVWPPEYVGCVV